MEFAEIENRLRLLEAVWTPNKKFTNQVVSVEPDKVIVRSSKEGSRDRPIRFRDIIDGTTSQDSRIIRSFRQILGLPPLPYDPAHPSLNDED